MSLTLKPGSRLFSAVCATEVIVVKAPSGEVDLTIGGAEPVDSAAARTGTASVVAGHDTGTVVGKRYVDDAATVELLCTKPGAGSLAVGEQILVYKDSKPLPASD